MPGRPPPPFDPAAPRDWFRKLRRERDRFARARSPLWRGDHLLNFAVTAERLVERLYRDGQADDLAFRARFAGLDELRRELGQRCPDLARFGPPGGVARPPGSRRTPALAACDRVLAFWRRHGGEYGLRLKPYD
jgi:hypothetical protein